jgi:hypothetical protein
LRTRLSHPEIVGADHEDNLIGIERHDRFEATEYIIGSIATDTQVDGVELGEPAFPGASLREAVSEKNYSVCSQGVTSQVAPFGWCVPSIMTGGAGKR